MIGSPPIVNLLAIRSKDIDRAVTFYEAIGLKFDKHSHGTGPEHYACDQGGFVFEIYPLTPNQQPTAWTRVGFSINNVDTLVDTLSQAGAKVISCPKTSEWGRRAVVKDFDGHSVELVEADKREQAD